MDYLGPEDRQKVKELLEEFEGRKIGTLNINVEVDMDDIVQDLWQSMML